MTDDDSPPGDSWKQALKDTMRQITQEAIERFTDRATWWRKAKVQNQKGTVSPICNGQSVGTPDIVKKLLRPLGMKYEDYIKRAKALHAARGSVPSHLLKACLVPLSVDGLVLRFGSVLGATITREDLSGEKATRGYVHGMFFARPSANLRTNLQLQPPANAQHPTSYTPFTYLRVGRAFKEQEQLRLVNRNFQLLALADWAMELGPGLFGLIRPSKSLHSTQISTLERGALDGKHGFASAKRDLKSVLEGSYVLYETDLADDYVERLAQSLQAKIPLHRKIRLGTIGTAYELAKKSRLNDCVLAIGHELMWALQADEESSLELLVSDLGHHERKLFSVLEQPYRIIVVAKGAVQEPELDLTARWFQGMSTLLRADWDQPGFYDFLEPELAKYGCLGGSNDKTLLRRMIKQGLHLHHPCSLAAARFVPLTEAFKLPATMLQHGSEEHPLSRAP